VCAAALRPPRATAPRSRIDAAAVEGALAACELEVEQPDVRALLETLSPAEHAATAAFRLDLAIAAAVSRHDYARLADLLRRVDGHAESVLVLHARELLGRLAIGLSHVGRPQALA
jgi:hypothetical protein